VVEDAGGVQRRGGGGAGGAGGGGQPDAVAQDEGVGAGDPLPGELGAGRVHAARRPRAPGLLPHQPGPPPPKVLHGSHPQILTPAIAVDMDGVASLLPSTKASSHLFFLKKESFLSAPK
jgi:hypothetical protein